jgi:hypothetical protein
MGTGNLSLGVERPGREADHSPPSSAEVKECVELYLYSRNMSSWRGAWLSTGTTLLLHFIASCTNISDKYKSLDGKNF